MAQRSITREIGPLSFRAMFAPSTLDADKRTVQVTWTTGARVQRGGFFTEPFLEELSLDDKHVRMGRLQSGRAPLLDSHNAERVADSLGVVQGAQLDPGGKTGSATVRFDSGTEGSDAMRRVGEGTLSDISVGYRVHKMKKMPDDEATKLPVYRAVDWEPHEMSLTPMGADTGAYARSEQPAQRNPCEIIIEERTMPEPVITLPVQPAAIPAAPAALTDEQRRAADAATAAERERSAVITRTGRALGRPQDEIDAAIASGTKIKHYQRAAIDAHAAATTLPIAGGGIIEPGTDARDKLERGMTAWLIERSGMAADLDTAIKAKPRMFRGWTFDSDAGEFVGMTLMDMAREALERAGTRTRGIRPDKMVDMALAQRSPTATTSDFPIILENVLYKVLLAQYAITPDVWREFCKIGSVTDFRINKRYRLGTFGSLDSLLENGEFKQKSIPDAERQTLIATTKGNLIGISRQAIINDDMGAFDTLASMFGRAAALSQELDVFALLAQNSGLGPTLSDSVALFDNTAHFNVPTGSAIGSTAIDLDRVAMARQKDVSKNEVLALYPSILLVPIELEGIAKQINNGQYDFDALSTKNPWVPNKVAGVFNKIIGTARLTGTRRYLFADPGIAPTIEVAYVNGQAQPFMDQQLGFDFDGIRWKVRMDYGVAAIDFRGAITNAGV